MDEDVELNGSRRFPGYGGAPYASMSPAFFFVLSRQNIQYQARPEPHKTITAAMHTTIIIAVVEF